MSDIIWIKFIGSIFIIFIWCTTKQLNAIYIQSFLCFILEFGRWWHRSLNMFYFQTLNGFLYEILSFRLLILIFNVTNRKPLSLLLILLLVWIDLIDQTLTFLIILSNRIFICRFLWWCFMIFFIKISKYIFTIEINITIWYTFRLWYFLIFCFM